jgi:hypothetical protein
VGFSGSVEPEAITLDGRTDQYASLDEESSRVSGHWVVFDGIEVAINCSDRYPERFRKEGDLI